MGVGRVLQLEGLRAIAILLVVFYHASVPGFSGGFVGVDVFFVLSGYLITGLLLGELERTGHVNLAWFWIRRIRRLVPGGVVAVIATVAIGAALLPAERLETLMTTALAALTYTSNLRFIAWSVDYYAAQAALDPLLHTWSLGVEAQFYLVWPLVVMATPRRLRLVVLIAIAVASLGLSILWTRVDQPLAFYGLPTRVWELIIGAFIAILSPNAPRWLGYAGLAAVIAATVLFDDNTLFPGWAVVLPVAGAAAIIAHPPAWLGARAMVWIGERSYSWYLWHWPLIVYAAMVVPGTMTKVAAGAAALALAHLSFRYVEQPFRTGRPFRAALEKTSMNRRSLSALIAVALFAALGTAYAQRMATPPGRIPEIIEGSDGWLFPGWDKLAEERPELVAAGVDRAVQQAHELEKRGAQVVVLLVPNKVRAHESVLPAEIREKVKASKGYAQLVEQLRGKGLVVVDSWPKFFKQDAHWTAESAEEAATKVADQLKKMGVKPVPGGAQPLGNWVTETLHGDLVTFLRSKGDMRFDKSPFKVRTRIEVPEKPPVVLVVGNSFVNEYLGFSRKLSNVLGVPVKTEYLQRATGPWSAMDDVLKAPSLPAKYVVWELQETSFSAQR
jgi:peptidoglycan/LPS O-acetylase OafA/YrhL